MSVVIATRAVASNVGPVALEPAPPPRAAPTERWFVPFAITLAGSLVFFLWQMAEYTTLLG